MGISLRNHSLIADEAVSIHGAIQKPSELGRFIELLADEAPRVIVEIGVHAGGTLYAWSQLAPIVIGVDMQAGGSEPIYIDSGLPRSEYGATMVIGDSHDAKTVAALAKALQGRPIDCLFIDGDHTYDGVRQDYEMYRSLVKVGGLIAFHDIVTHPWQVCEVERLWHEIKDETAVEIIDTDSGRWGGIGVLRNVQSLRN